MRASLRVRHETPHSPAFAADDSFPGFGDNSVSRTMVVRRGDSGARCAGS